MITIIKFARDLASAVLAGWNAAWTAALDDWLASGTARAEAEERYENENMRKWFQEMYKEARGREEWKQS